MSKLDIDEGIGQAMEWAARVFANDIWFNICYFDVAETDSTPCKMESLIFRTGYDEFKICRWYRHNDNTIWYSLRDVYNILTYEHPGTFNPKWRGSDDLFAFKSSSNSVMNGIKLTDHILIVDGNDSYCETTISNQLILRVLDRTELIDDELTRRVNWLRRTINEK